MDDTMGLGLGSSTVGRASRMTWRSRNRGGGGCFGTVTGRGPAPKEARYDFASLAEGFERRMDTIKSCIKAMSKFSPVGSHVERTFSEELSMSSGCCGT